MFLRYLKTWQTLFYPSSKEQTTLPPLFEESETLCYTGASFHTNFLELIFALQKLWSQEDTWCLILAGLWPRFVGRRPFFSGPFHGGCFCEKQKPFFWRSTSGKVMFFYFFPICLGCGPRLRISSCRFSLFFSRWAAPRCFPLKNWKNGENSAFLEQEPNRKQALGMPILQSFYLCYHANYEY